MKNRLWISILALSASLLAACNQSGGGGAGGGDPTTPQRVIVRQLDTEGAVGMYRLEGRSGWSPLNLAGGVASFTAQSGYEVAIRCSHFVLFFKDTVQRCDQITFTCSTSSSGGATYRDFEVNVPAAVGTNPVRIRDLVFLGQRIEQYQGTNPLRLYGVPIEPGSGEVLVTLLQYDGVDQPLRPLGYRAVRVDAGAPGTVVVDREGWQPFAGERTISSVGPLGYALSGSVQYLRDSQLTFSTLGLALSAGGSSNLTFRYGLLPRGC